jgi:hypothetical protein
VSEDLAYVLARIPEYRHYEDEGARHDSDMRVRAFVGERLSRARARHDGTLDGATVKVLDDVLFRCMFTDQVFIRKFEHARLDAPMVAALVRSDRELIVLAERATDADASDLRAVAVEIDKQFEYRRAPEPLHG